MDSCNIVIAIFSTDAQLEVQLKTLTAHPQFAYTFTTHSEFCPEVANSANILICDAALANIETVRTACNKNTHICYCVDTSANRQLAEELADEVWLKPFSYTYALKRVGKKLLEYKERKDFSITRIFLETIIDTSPDLIWFKDKKGAHLKVNKAFCHAVGKTKAQIEGRGHYYIWDIPADEYAEGEYVCLETEEIVLAKRELCLFDEKVKCKQGVRQFKTYKAPLFDEDGALIGTTGVAQDVTRLMQLKNAPQLGVDNARAVVDVAHIYYWKLDLSTKVALLGSTYASELNLPQRLENYPECLIERGLLHTSSIETCHNAHKLICAGQHEVSYDARLYTLTAQLVGDASSTH